MTLLRLYGGWDIKLNEKKWIKRFFVSILILSLLLALFQVINYTVSLQLGDKFIGNYMTDIVSEEHLEGVKGVFLWIKFKKDISAVLLMGLFIPVLVYCVWTHILWSCSSECYIMQTALSTLFPMIEFCPPKQASSVRKRPGRG